MPSTKKLQPGIGAVADALIKYIHPSQYIRDKYPNPMNGQRLQNCLLIRKEEKQVNRKKQECFVFRHDEFPDKELHCVQRWVKIVKEGGEDQLFESENGTTQVEGEEANATPSFELPPAIYHATGVAEDIAMVRAQGLDVDDDNEPAPENVPSPNKTGTEKLPNGLYQGQIFGWNGVDHRAKEGHHDMDAKMKGMPDINFVSHIQMFLLFFSSRPIGAFGHGGN